jgi:ABC-2 type transport system permease protein
MNIKRLYKKASFIAILALVPIAVIALSVAAEQDSGFVHITLASYDSDDKIAQRVIDEFMSESSIVRFSRSNTPAEAIRAVSMGEADEAWIFDEDAEKKLGSYSALTSSGDSFVTVVGREENVFLSLTREKLTGTLYKYCAEVHYIDFARHGTDGRLDSLTDSELLEYFENVNITEQMFTFGNSSDVTGGESSSAEGYMTAPVRGLLGVLCVVCGLAAAMYYVDDQKRGAFAKIPESRRMLIAPAAIAVAVINVAAVSFVSMKLSGVSASLLYELASAFLYTACVSGFCLLVLTLLRTNELIGSAILPLSVVMIAVCPVFFDFRAFIAVQLMFPPTYYVNAVYDPAYLAYMLVYFGVCIALSLFVDEIVKFAQRSK